MLSISNCIIIINILYRFIKIDDYKLQKSADAFTSYIVLHIKLKYFRRLPCLYTHCTDLVISDKLAHLHIWLRHACIDCIVV